MLCSKISSPCSMLHNARMQILSRPFESCELLGTVGRDSFRLRSSLCLEQQLWRHVSLQIPGIINIGNWIEMRRNYPILVALSVTDLQVIRYMHVARIKLFLAHWLYSFPVSPMNFLIPKKVRVHHRSTGLSLHHSLPKLVFSKISHPGNGAQS